MLLIKQNKQIMGRKFKTNHILPTALILSCALLGSCEKNSFDPDKSDLRRQISGKGHRSQHELEDDESDFSQHIRL